MKKKTIVQESFEKTFVEIIRQEEIHKNSLDRNRSGNYKDEFVKYCFEFFCAGKNYSDEHHKG